MSQKHDTTQSQTSFFASCNPDTRIYAAYSSIFSISMRNKNVIFVQRLRNRMNFMSLPIVVS